MSDSESVGPRLDVEARQENQMQDDHARVDTPGAPVDSLTASQIVLATARYALDEARRTITVDHPVRIQVEAAIEAIDELAALPAPAPSDERLRALARIAARDEHDENAYDGKHGVMEVHGHIYNSDPDVSFNECPHPDCVLVRAALPAREPSYDAPKGDVLPWLDEAITDYERETYRPSAHYLKLFKGAANTIRELRAAAPAREDAPPQLQVSDRDANGDIVIRLTGVDGWHLAAHGESVEMALGRLGEAMMLAAAPDGAVSPNVEMELDHLIRWALGEDPQDEFPNLPHDWPRRKFYWRNELRKRYEAIKALRAAAPEARQEK